MFRTNKKGEVELKINLIMPRKNFTKRLSMGILILSKKGEVILFKLMGMTKLKKFSARYLSQCQN
ncbi:MAG: hypothetical protein CM15mP58_18180 [Burkholderiaceae bacterium]|nr:MAG: hypothetical protein CM15mP58_18180 [Burkholderiaceae bacterium]